MFLSVKSISALLFIGGAHQVVAKAGVLDAIGQMEKSNSMLLQYPTQYTQDIVPKSIHSHNDYWRDVPLLTAISLGVQSVEADVWLEGDQLLVGHEMAALVPERTFESLYVGPLLSILNKQNHKSQFVVNQTQPNGVFDTSSGTSLQLLIDMKTDGPSTFPVVVKALQPLRAAGYLTTFQNGVLTKSAVTAIGTGNTPLAGVMASKVRDVFFDAPLTALNTTPNVIFDITLSPIASTDYEVAVGWNGIDPINKTQLDAINLAVADAHALGIKARFWDTPGWPISARTAVWQQLRDSHADWLNADDLVAASQF